MRSNRCFAHCYRNINAGGEEQTAPKLLNAARILAQQPQAMHLRYLSTLAMISSQNNSAIGFSFPIELDQALKGTVENGVGSE